MLEQQILNQTLTRKSQNFTKTTDDFNHYLEEGRLIYKESFFQIVIVASGTLSLSVSYVGYITSLNGEGLYFLWLLFSGWILLVLAVIGGLYRNYIHTTFGHWQMQIYRITALMELKQTTLELVTKFPEQIADIDNEKEMKNYIKTLKSNLKKYQGAIDFNKKKESIYKFLWLLSEKMALFGFSLGLIAIIVFAALNLPHN